MLMLMWRCTIGGECTSGWLRTEEPSGDCDSDSEGDGDANGLDRYMAAGGRAAQRQGLRGGRRGRAEQSRVR